MSDDEIAFHDDKVAFDGGTVLSALDFLLENLKQLLDDSKLILKLKDETQNLYRNLDLIKSCLSEYLSQRNKKHFQVYLVKKIREVVYEAEDVVDTFIREKAMHKDRNFIRRRLHSFQYKKQNFKDIVTKVQSTYGMVKDLDFELKDGEGSTWKANMKKLDVLYKLDTKDDVVGFEDEAQTVTDLLIRGSQDLEVISIVGMGGLGKTTLAKMIYCDPRIEFEFSGRAWVHVSAKYSRREIFLRIWSQFSKPSDDMYKMTDENIATKLCAVLEREKYLIVMDDLWTEDVLNDLKIAFPNNKKHSRILLTTRNMAVAYFANPMREPYRLRLLTDEESFTLLTRKALGKHDIPGELMRPGKEIAAVCRGLPLALVVIGGILRETDAASYWWDKVARNVHAYISGDELSSHIAASFNFLPYHLKTCFLYFGVFPEGYEMPVSKLVRLWIAEGFIQQREEMSLEDTAMEYLGDLLMRNLVMAGKRRPNGELKTCRVHEIIHAFCKNQAEDEGFFKEIKRFEEDAYLSSKLKFKMNPRRLCIHSDIISYIDSVQPSPSVRSFLCFSKDKVNLHPQNTSSIPRAFKLLRVLEAKPISFHRFPPDLREIIHLRYLVLSCHLNFLPAAISSLWNLETLSVETSSQTFEIKGDIWKMIRLRHLETNALTSLTGIAAKSHKTTEDSCKNANLRTLSTISPKSCTEDVLAGAPNLKKLGIRGKLARLLDTKNGSCLFDSVGKLERLENLKLLNDVHPLPPPEGKLPRLPETNKFPPKLKQLTLVNTGLDWEHMSTLGKLESLEILKLKDNAFIGEMWVTQDGCFPSLQVLHIGKTDLILWKSSSDHFPRLRSLCLRDCGSLEAIPLGLANVSSLDTIVLHCTTISAAASAKRILQRKKMSEEEHTTKGIEFKLSIYPPQHYQ